MSVIGDLAIEEVIAEPPQHRRGRQLVQHEHAEHLAPVLDPFCLCLVCQEAWLTLLARDQGARTRHFFVEVVS